MQPDLGWLAWPGPFQEVDAFGGHGPVAPETRFQPGNDFLFRTVGEALAPEAGFTAAFRVVKQTGVRGFECCETAQTRNLFLRAPAGWGAPDLPRARAVRGEVDPLPIVRPA